MSTRWFLYTSIFWCKVGKGRKKCLTSLCHGFSWCKHVFGDPLWLVSGASSDVHPGAVGVLLADSRGFPLPRLTCEFISHLLSAVGVDFVKLLLLPFSLPQPLHHGGKGTGCRQGFVERSAFFIRSNALAVTFDRLNLQRSRAGEDELIRVSDLRRFFVDMISQKGRVRYGCRLQETSLASCASKSHFNHWKRFLQRFADKVWIRIRRGFLWTLNGRENQRLGFVAEPLILIELLGHPDPLLLLPGRL